MSDSQIAFGMVCMLAMGVLFGVLLGHARTRDVIQGRAIEANAAEWQIDPKTGEKEFVWLGVEAERAVDTEDAGKEK